MAGRRGAEVDMHWSDLFNSAGSLFIVATASTKTMVPLRILAIVANCSLVVFYAATHAWIPLVLQGAALPLNGWRLYQMLLLIRQVRDAIRGNTSMDWLKPFMTARHFRKGDILFAKGEPAEEMFCTMTGRYVLIELGIEIQSGEVIGELGMLAPGRLADILILDRAPNLCPLISGVGQVVYSAVGLNVDTVIVDGRIVLAHGELALVDGAEIVRTAQRIARDLWTRHGQ